MDKSWKKDAKRRVAEVIEDIIKMTSKEEIIMFVKNQSLFICFISSGFRN
jgi:hypothetical protein